MYSQTNAIDLIQKNNKQIAHDLRSPISALNIISSTIPEMPESTRLLLEMTISRVKEIADSLEKDPAQQTNQEF